MRERAFPIVALACVSGCVAQPPKSADVYFRPFEATSIARLDESMMVKAGSAFHVSDAARLSRILAIIDVPCAPSPRTPDKMDLRLLIYFSGDDGRTTWKASRFDYYDGSKGKTCEMTPALLEALSKEFAGEQPR